MLVNPALTSVHPHLFPHQIVLKTIITEAWHRPADNFAVCRCPPITDRSMFNHSNTSNWCYYYQCKQYNYSLHQSVIPQMCYLLKVQVYRFKLSGPVGISGGSISLWSKIIASFLTNDESFMMCSSANSGNPEAILNGSFGFWKLQLSGFGTNLRMIAASALSGLSWLMRDSVTQWQNGH